MDTIQCHKTFSVHKQSLCDVFTLKNYDILSKRRAQRTGGGHQWRRNSQSNSGSYTEKFILKFVRMVAVVTDYGNLLNFMLLTLMKVLMEKSKQHCLLWIQQPNMRYIKMNARQRVYLLSTISVILLIQLTALQQVHGSEYSNSSNSNSNNSSSRSSSSSSSTRIIRRSESIEKPTTQYLNHLSITSIGSISPNINVNTNIRTSENSLNNSNNNGNKYNYNNVSVNTAPVNNNSSHDAGNSHDSQSNLLAADQPNIQSGNNYESRHSGLQRSQNHSSVSNVNNSTVNLSPLHTHVIENVSNSGGHKITYYYSNASLTNDDILPIFNGQHDFISSSSLENENPSTCSSCQSRERAKLYTLESIKNQILRRLRLEKPPNISIPIQVPSKILDEFYKKFNASQNKGRRSSYAEHTVPQNQIQSANEFKQTQSSSLDYLMDMQDDYATAADMQSYPLNTDDLNIPLNDDSLYHNAEQYEYNNNDPHYMPDEYYSSVNSVFLFPTKPRIRHNKKLEILNFKLDPKYLTVTRTIFHIYVRGIEWIREHKPALLERKHDNGTAIDLNNIVLTFHRAVRQQNAVNYSHSIKLLETNIKLPSGPGRWINVEVKQLSAYWKNNPGMTQGIIVRGIEKWMRPLIVTGEKEDALTVHIEVKVKEKRRQKRSVSFDCKESDNEKRCCRYPLKVNFTNFGWDFVIAPTSFDAYFCNGECNIGFNPKHTHTYVTSLAMSASPCCSPTKMSPLSLLYFNDNQMLVMSTIPNMSVEQCSCL